MWKMANSRFAHFPYGRQDNDGNLFSSDTSAKCPIALWLKNATRHLRLCPKRHSSLSRLMELVRTIQTASLIREFSWINLGSGYSVGSYNDFWRPITILIFGTLALGIVSIINGVLALRIDEGRALLVTLNASERRMAQILASGHSFWASTYYGQVSDSVSSARIIAWRQQELLKRHPQ